MHVYTHYIMCSIKNNSKNSIHQGRRQSVQGSSSAQVQEPYAGMKATGITGAGNMASGLLPLTSEGINRDISLLQNKIASLTSASSSSSSSSSSISSSSSVSSSFSSSSAAQPVQSSFVSGLRSIAASANTIPSPSNNITNPPSALVEELRLDLGRLLGKVTELERLVLRQTEPKNQEGDRSLSLTRKTANIELACLPLHLQVLDRLVDLFNQSKRVTIISNAESSSDVSNTSVTVNHITSGGSGSGNSNGNGNSQANNVNSNTDAAAKKLQLLVEEKEASLAAAQASLVSAKGEVSLAQKQLVVTLESNKLLEERLSAYELEKSQILIEITRMKERLTMETKEFEEKVRSDHEVTIRELNNRHSIEVIAMQSKLADAEARIGENALEREKIERDAALKARVQQDQQEQHIEHSFYEILKDKTKNIKASSCFDNLIGDGTAKGSSSGLNYEKLAAVSSCHRVNFDNYSNLSAIGKELFKDLDDQVNLKMSRLCETISILYTLKDGLESELQTYQLERTLLNRDFASLSTQLQAQRTAYQALEIDNVNMTRKLLQLNASSDEAAINQARLEDLQETVMSLQNELMKNSRRMLAYDKLPDRIADLEIKLSEAGQKLVQLSSERDQLSVDLETYKKLSDSLKNKIKENWSKAATGKAGGGQDFMDSFEEVMKEEMMAMKMAFEAKLKIAREEAEAMTRKHRLEISNLSKNGF